MSTKSEIQEMPRGQVLGLIDQAFRELWESLADHDSKTGMPADIIKISQSRPQKEVVGVSSCYSQKATKL